MHHYLIRLFRIALAFVPLYVLLRRPWRYSPRRELVLGAFSLFMTALLILALEGDYSTPFQMYREAHRRLISGESINLTPFYTISSFFRYTSTDVFLLNIGGNVLMFVPWGFGLMLLWKDCRRPLKLLALCLLPTLTIELMQLFIGRHVDVDDLILNFAGSLLGALLWRLLSKKHPSLNTLAK